VNKIKPQIGAEFLQKFNGGMGILLGGVPGVPKGKVTIIGGGQFNGFDIIVCTLPSNRSFNSCRRLGLTSNTVTSAPKPNAMGILLGGVPGVPKGKVTIIGGGQAGTNAAKIALGLGLPATSLIGLNNGNERSGNCTVS
jgi:alanine dehydrogenase